MKYSYEQIFAISTIISLLILFLQIFYAYFIRPLIDLKKAKKDYDITLKKIDVKNIGKVFLFMTKKYGFLVPMVVFLAIDLCIKIFAADLERSPLDDILLIIAVLYSVVSFITGWNEVAKNNLIKAINDKSFDSTLRYNAYGLYILLLVARTFSITFFLMNLLMNHSFSSAAFALSIFLYFASFYLKKISN